MYTLEHCISTFTNGAPVQQSPTHEVVLQIRVGQGVATKICTYRGTVHTRNQIFGVKRPLSHSHTDVVYALPLPRTHR